MKYIILVGLLAALQLQAQNLEWFESLHNGGVERMRQLTFVESSETPYLITYTERIIPEGGGGGGGPEVDHFIFAYDTSGNSLWNTEVLTAPVKVIDSGDGNFWYISYGLDEFEFGSATISSDFPWPEYTNIYFIKSNMNGDVLESFYWEISEDLVWTIQDIDLDINGDFIFTGYMTPDQLSSVPMSFADEDFILHPDYWTPYLARASSNGDQLGIALMQTNRFGNKATVRFLEQNTSNGDIVISGRINDVLTIGDESISSDSQHAELFLLQFNENLEYQEGSVYPSSTYGSISSDLTFNPVNQRFYSTGTLGDELFLLDEDNPISGHFGSANNCYLAAFDGIDLIQGVYLIPTGPGSTDNVNIQHVTFDDQGNLRLAVNVHDFSFYYGDSLISINSGVLSYDIAFMTLDANSFELLELSLTTSAGQTYAHQTHYNPGGNAFYVCGTFNGTFQYNDFSHNSFGGQNDGFLMKLVDSTETFTSIPPSMQSENFTVYPNPAESYFTIQIDQPVMAVQLLNLRGQVVREYQQDESTHFNVSDLPIGLYMVSIQTTQHHYVQKLILN